MNQSLAIVFHPPNSTSAYTCAIDSQIMRLCYGMMVVFALEVIASLVLITILLLVYKG
jgi:hypothetical protein